MIPKTYTTFFFFTLSLFIFSSCQTLPTSLPPDRGTLLFLDKTDSYLTRKNLSLRNRHGQNLPTAPRKISDRTWIFSPLPEGEYQVVDNLGSRAVPLSAWVRVYPGWETGTILRPGQIPGTSQSAAAGTDFVLDPRETEKFSLEASPYFPDRNTVILSYPGIGPVMAEGDLGGGWHNRDGLPWFRKSGSSTWIFGARLEPDSFLEYKITDSLRTLEEDRTNLLRKTSGDGRDGNSWISHPDAGILPRMKVSEDLPRGKVESFEWEGPQEGFRRRVTVWTPPGYPAPGVAYPTVYFHDAQMHLGVHITDVFDHYLAEGQITPFVAVLVDNAGSWRNAEFLPQGQVPASWTMASSVEKAISQGKVPEWYRNLPKVYLRFLMEKVIPEVESRFQVSRRPEDRGIVGASNGSILNFFLQNQYPGVFGNMACESGYTGDLDFSQAGKAPLKLWFSFGSYEIDRSSFTGMVGNLKSKLKDQPLVELTTALYPGGHNPIAWNTEFPHIFRWWWKH